MDQREQQREVAIELAIEDGLQIELHVGRADQGGGITQEAKQTPVGQQPPQVRRR